MGHFYIQFDEICFPSYDWEDFCIQIVSDWIDTINNSCYNSTFRLYFMDGPYYLLCHRKKNCISISAVDDHSGSIIAKESFPLLIMQTQLAEIAKMLLKCRDKSDNCASDFILLDDGLQKLEKGLK